MSRDPVRGGGKDDRDPPTGAARVAPMPGKQTRSQQTAPQQAGSGHGSRSPPTAADVRAATQKLAPWVMDDDSMSAMGLGPLGGEEEESREGGREGAESEDPRARASGSEGMWRHVIGERSTSVGKLGRVRAPSGVRLRKGAAAGQPDLGILPFGELVSIERRTEHGWCWVIATGALAGNAGFCEEQFLAMDPPEPGAELYRVAPGDELRQIAERAYGKSFRGGRDARLYVQALYEANKGQKGIYLTEVELSRKESAERLEDDEHTLEIYRGAKVREGHAIWLPSEAFIEQLRTSGAISDGTPAHAQLARGLKNTAGHAVEGARYGAAFTVGLLEGSWSSIADLFQGAADMVQTVAQTLYQLVTGDLGAIKDMLLGWVEKLKVAWAHRGDLAADFMAKWEAEDAWTRGNFQGEVLGWVMMTALLILATAGEAAVAMATGKWATILRILRAADALGDVTTYVSKVTRLPAKAADVIRRKVGKGADVATESAEAAALKEGQHLAGEVGGIVDAEEDAVRAISSAGHATPRQGSTSKPELQNVRTSLDGHTFNNDIRKMSASARHVIRQLEKQGWVRVAEIMPQDLVEISKWFQKEIGVVQSPYGALRIILGTQRGVLKKQLKPGEIFLAHTHPVVTTMKDHFDLDLPNSGRHVEAVVDWSGQITYFNRNGIKNPTRSTGLVAPLLDYKAAFIDENGAIVGYADIDILDQSAGVSIRIRK